MGKDKQMLEFFLEPVDVQNNIFEREKFRADIKT